MTNVITLIAFPTAWEAASSALPAALLASSPIEARTETAPAQPLEVWDGSWTTLQVNLELGQASQLAALVLSKTLNRGQ